MTNSTSNDLNNTSHNVDLCCKGQRAARYFDPRGAAFYIVAVMLVYSISIVALIMSRIKRKHVKLLEDREIHKYLREFQVVKEKSTRDSYHDMKKAIMARLTNTKDHKSPSSSSSVNSQASSCASLTTMTSSCAAMGKSVFPLLNVAYSFHTANWNCGCPQESCSHKIRRNPSWHSGDTFFHSSHVTKQTIGSGIGTPTLATVMECYDGERETSFGFDFDLRKHSLPSEDEDFMNVSQEIKQSLDGQSKDATTLKNTFAFDFGGTPFESKKTHQHLQQIEKLRKEKKVKEIKRSCKKETIIGDEQKINWVEVSESEVKYEKILTSTTTSRSLKLPDDNSVKILASQKPSEATKGIFLKTSSVTKTLPPQDLSSFSAENPLKITDSFDSPVVETMPLSALQININSKESFTGGRKHDRNKTKLEIRPAVESEKKIPLILKRQDKCLQSTEDVFNNNDNGTTCDPICPATSRAIESTETQTTQATNANTCSSNGNRGCDHTVFNQPKNIFRASTFSPATFHFDENPPTNFGNRIESFFCEQDTKLKAGKLCQPFKRSEDEADLDGFNMARFEKMFLSKGSIKFADDNEETKTSETKELLEKDEESEAGKKRSENRGSRKRKDNVWRRKLLSSNDFSSDDPKDYEDSRFSYDEDM